MSQQIPCGRLSAPGGGATSSTAHLIVIRTAADVDAAHDVYRAAEVPDSHIVGWASGQSFPCRGMVVRFDQPSFSIPSQERLPSARELLLQGATSGLVLRTGHDDGPPIAMATWSTDASKARRIAASLNEFHEASGSTFPVEAVVILEDFVSLLPGAGLRLMRTLLDIWEAADWRWVICFRHVALGIRTDGQTFRTARAENVSSTRFFQDRVGMRSLGRCWAEDFSSRDITSPQGSQRFDVRSYQGWMGGRLRDLLIQVSAALRARERNVAGP